MALRQRGWHVTGDDRDPGRVRRALELGAIDAAGRDPGADITFVAVPVGSIAGEVRRCLDEGARLVTDVGSVKGPVVAELDDPRYVGGHPMAGSEQEGVEGADPDLFVDATWVLTPTEVTDGSAYAEVHSVVSSLGAEVLALAPEEHDELVATVSHIPHLVAVTLMDLAESRSRRHHALLRLAAGGFRDMTRIASGHPGIWPDICQENRRAIVAALDELTDRLHSVRDLVATGDRDGLLEILERARKARAALPGPLGRVGELAEVRVPVPDRPGVIAEVTTLASTLGVNIYDIEIAHSAESPRGLLILLVAADRAHDLRRALAAGGHRPVVEGLG